ncbi:putative esterase [Luteitalea pratensis]|uniref:Putative esterase n=1 Tax=Luteitalea pratensis TaxID=1855912 RepID=A0A143PLV3_LUTPR|nr:alpha/beta hydrolase [Luteitalea pratensis]AMY09471.1 putative esterase [Luteitalea pratensis]
MLIMVAARTLSLGAQAPSPSVERNVVYGMFSGLALLMDVHRPARPNGIGIVAIVGTGFHAGTAYNSPPMKDHPAQLGIFVQPLVASGYTVFVINHRGMPIFRHPAALQDAERAVRFVRHNAARFGIAALRIGAVGASSGGYLAAMLGVRAGTGDAADPDEANRDEARVQAVVAFCPPTDLTGPFDEFGLSATAAYIGNARLPDPKSPEWRLYRDASPVNSVTADDAPVLLIHGDKDTTVPLEHSEKMEVALKAASVATKLVRVPGAGHRMAPNPENIDFTAEMIRWFDSHLRSR